MQVAVGRGMRTPFIVVIAQAALFISAWPAHADWMPVVSGPITRVVAAQNHVVAVRKHEVLILHEDGGLLSRIAERVPAAAGVNRRDIEQIAEATLDRLEIPETDRGTDYADDLVDDESRLGQRRRWRLARRNVAALSSAIPPGLAASSAEIWIGTDRGIYRIDQEGQLAKRFGRQWLGRGMAAAASRIVVDRGTSLALLSTDSPETQVLPMSAPVEHLAISSTGRRVAWASGNRISGIGPAGSSHVEAASAIVDLVFCGETLVALLATGLVAIPPGGRAEMRASPPGARRMICPAGSSMPWLSVGGGLWLSSDQGLEWNAAGVPSRLQLLDVAVSDEHVWLATEDGLFASVDTPAPAPMSDVARDDAPGTSLFPRGARRGSARASWLSWLLPKVSLRGAVAITTSGHDVEGFALAAFPLGREIMQATASGTSLEGPPEPPPGPASTGLAIDPHDSDAPCLVVARRKAVELAMAEPERARSYVTRAGHAAWLPELRVLVSRRYGRSESLDLNGASTALSSPLGIDTVNDLRYEARATWDLARLVFSPDELAAQAQALHMAELRRDIETTVNRLYFERRRLVVAPAAHRQDGVGAKLRSQEVEAELDAISAGAFGTCLSERGPEAR
jgi:hypothetical protein